MKKTPSRGVSEVAGELSERLLRPLHSGPARIVDHAARRVDTPFLVLRAQNAKQLPLASGPFIGLCPGNRVNGPEIPRAHTFIAFFTTTTSRNRREPAQGQPCLGLNIPLHQPGADARRSVEAAFDLKYVSEEFLPLHLRLNRSGSSSGFRCSLRWSRLSSVVMLANGKWRVPINITLRTVWYRTSTRSGLPAKSTAKDSGPKHSLGTVQLLLPLLRWLEPAR